MIDDFDIEGLEWTCEMWDRKPDGKWKVTTYDVNDEIIDERTEQDALLTLWDNTGAGMCIRYTDCAEIRQRKEVRDRREKMKLVVDNG